MTRAIRSAFAGGLGCMLVWFAAATLQPLSGHAASSASGAPILELIATIPVGGGPEAMAVDCCDGRGSRRSPRPTL